MTPPFVENARGLQRARLRREASQLVPERLDPGHAIALFGLQFGAPLAMLALDVDQGAVRSRPALAEIAFELGREIVDRLVSFCCAARTSVLRPSSRVCSATITRLLAEGSITLVSPPPSPNAGSRLLKKPPRLPHGELARGRIRPRRARRTRTPRGVRSRS